MAITLGNAQAFAPGGFIAPGDPSFVKMVQQLLNVRGYKLEVDGLSGENTQRAISDFQVKNGLPGTGMADQKTFALLRTPPKSPAPPPIPQIRPTPDQLGQGLTGPAAMMPRMSPLDQGLGASPPPVAPAGSTYNGPAMDFSHNGPDLWAYPSMLSAISRAGTSLNYDSGGTPKKTNDGPSKTDDGPPFGPMDNRTLKEKDWADMYNDPWSGLRVMFPNETGPGISPTGIHNAPKKWWGGPLGGIVQSMRQQMPQGLAGALATNKGTISPLMPSLSGLLARPAGATQQQMPMGFASGGPPQVIKMNSPKSVSSKIGHISSPKAPRYLRPPPVYHTPKAVGMKSPSPNGMFSDSPVPGTGQTFPGGLAAGGGIEGAGATKINGADMLIRSALGLHNLPNNFYYQPSPWPRNAVPPKPTEFEKATPPEMQLHKQDPTKFGYPVAGLLNSTVPGRTDQLPITVASGSYVVPADVISGLGQGNTQAGAHLLEQIIGSPESGSGQGFAEGGTPGHIPIVAAGGEYIIPPKVVSRIGQGDEGKGHDILDGMVRKIRTQVAHHMLKLPGPKRD